MLIKMNMFYGHAHSVSYGDKNSFATIKYFAYAALSSVILLC